MPTNVASDTLFTMPEATLGHVMQYLVGRPYQEVAQLLGVIQQTTKKVEPKAAAKVEPNLAKAKGAAKVEPKAAPAAPNAATAEPAPAEQKAAKAKGGAKAEAA